MPIYSGATLIKIIEVDDVIITKVYDENFTQLYPTGSIGTTFQILTYEPVIGSSSSCDELTHHDYEWISSKSEQSCLPYCTTADWSYGDYVGYGLSSCSNTGTCSCSHLGQTGYYCHGYWDCASVDWTLDSTDYEVSSCNATGTCSSCSNLYELGNGCSSGYQVCSGVGWSYVTVQQVVSCSASGTCSLCAHVDNTGYTCSSGYQVCTGVGWSSTGTSEGYTSCTATGTCSLCAHVNNNGYTCQSYQACSTVGWDYYDTTVGLSSCSNINGTCTSCSLHLGNIRYVCSAGYQVCTAAAFVTNSTELVVSCTASGTCNCSSLGNQGVSCTYTSTYGNCVVGGVSQGCTTQQVCQFSFGTWTQGCYTKAYRTCTQTSSVTRYDRDIYTCEIASTVTRWRRHERTCVETSNETRYDRTENICSVTNTVTRYDRYNYTCE